jgi:hypothetical protein
MICFILALGGFRVELLVSWFACIREPGDPDRGTLRPGSAGRGVGAGGLWPPSSINHTTQAERESVQF